MNRTLLSIAVLLVAIPSPASPTGDLTSRFDLTLERVRHGGPPVYERAFVLADAVPQHVRRFTEFSGDVSGRYIGALAEAARFRGERIPELDQVVAELLSLQKPEGYFGDSFSAETITKSEMALLWGNGRLLTGLLEYYRYKPTPGVLACAQRLGDWMVKIRPRLNQEAVRAEFSRDQVATGYICWTQVIEGLVELHRVTGDSRYLLLSEDIAKQSQRHPKQHSHGFVTTLRGILELYRDSHAQQYLQQVEHEWQGIIDSGNLWPHGALPEIFRPGNKRTEGCSEADWLRLNLALWTETRNSRYLENAELTLFNEFALNQFHTGDYGHRTLTEQGIAPGCARAWWCCTFHGLRAFPEIFATAFSSRPDGLSYDLPVEGNGNSKGLAVRVESTLARDGQITLVVQNSAGSEQTLAVRKPRWASAVEFRLGRELLKPVASENNYEIRRTWRKGDTLTLTYLLRTEVVKLPRTERVMLLHGPWILGVDDVTSPSFFDEPCVKTQIILPVANPAGQVTLSKAKEEPDKSGPFQVPVAHCQITFVPGGYPVQPQTAFLHPIAEQTGLPDTTAWTWRFEVKSAN